MTEPEERTVRSFCRICTAVCGILVDVSGDEVVRVLGELTGVAKVDRAMPAGAVSVPHGHQGANVNRLTWKDQIDLPTGMVRYLGAPVTRWRATARRPSPMFTCV